MLTAHQIDSERVILAHTMLKNWVKSYEDKPILVLGGKNDDVDAVGHASAQIPASPKNDLARVDAMRTTALGEEPWAW